MTTTTWRDIADQLTPEQAGELERWEALGDEPSTLLLFAREYASENKTRVFVSAERRIGGVRLRVCGRQQPDGAIERWVELSARDVRRSAMSRSTSCARLCSIRAAEVSAAARTRVRIIKPKAALAQRMHASGESASTLVSERQVFALDGELVDNAGVVGSRTRRSAKELEDAVIRQVRDLEESTEDVERMDETLHLNAEEARLAAERDEVRRRLDVMLSDIEMSPNSTPSEASTACGSFGPDSASTMRPARPRS